MIQEIIIPKRKRLTINIPESLIGKRVEVIVKEAEKRESLGSLPADLKDKAFWEDIAFDASFPSTEEIRSTAWPDRL